MTMTSTRTRTTSLADDAFARAFEAGLIVWENDMPTAPLAPTQAAPEAAPAEDVFQASGAQLRTWGFTPTGRERKGAQGEAARAEITRRAARKAARKAAR